MWNPFGIHLGSIRNAIGHCTTEHTRMIRDKRETSLVQYASVNAVTRVTVRTSLVHKHISLAATLIPAASVLLDSRKDFAQL